MSESPKSVILTLNDSIIDAIKIIDASPLQIVLVVDERDQLLGTITDGDIRRGILSGVTLDSSVKKVMNPKPRVAKEGVSENEMLSIMRKNYIQQLPIINEDGHIVSVALRSDLRHSLAERDANAIAQKTDKHDDVWIVLMLGGLGSRLMPLTEDIPKPMLEVGEAPLLENIVKNFVGQGYKHFYFSVNYKSEVIKNHFGDGSKFGIQIIYLEEQKRMGTAGALSLIPNKHTAPLIVMNGDILTNSNFDHLLSFHQQTKATATMCVREYEQQVPYGVIENSGTKLQSITEKPSQKYFVNAGIYMVNPEALEHVKNEEYLDMPDLFKKLEQAGHDSAVFPIREYWLDIGSLDDLERGRAEYETIFKTGTVQV